MIAVTGLAPCYQSKLFRQLQDVAKRAKLTLNKSLNDGRRILLCIKGRCVACKCPHFLPAPQARVPLAEGPNLGDLKALPQHPCVHHVGNGPRQGLALLQQPLLGGQIAHTRAANSRTLRLHQRAK